MTGPAATAVASAARLGWRFIGAEQLVTDDGNQLHLASDPAAVIVAEVEEAVRRWRWRNIERRRPSLDSSGRGAGTCMKPLWLPLRSKQNDDKWGPKVRGALRSVTANRQ